MENITFENPPLEQIFQVMKDKRFTVFDGTVSSGAYYDYDLNIVGVRNANIKSDLFDDKYIVFYRLDKNWKIHYLSCTTDPGKAELIDPSFPAAQQAGTFILKDNEQYRGAWTLGYHGAGNWRHVGLLQTSAVKGYRDNNRDEILDLLPNTITEGFYGINHHSALLWKDTEIVGRWSAGCQVINKVNEYKFLVDLWQRAAKIWGPRFSYTLLHKNDFK